MFSVAGLLALYGTGALVATAILALGLTLPEWLAALTVGLALVTVAGVVALWGKRKLGESAPPVPTRTIQNLKRDIETVRRPGLLRSRAPESQARLQDANHE